MDLDLSDLEWLTVVKQVIKLGALDVHVPGIENFLENAVDLAMAKVSRSKNDWMMGALFFNLERIQCLSARCILAGSFA